MQSFNFKRLLPHVYIVAGFALLALLYCYPILQGKVLSQHDNISWQGMFQETKTYHEKTGENPLWTNSMFGGMPTYTIGVPETNNYAGYLNMFLTSFLGKPASYFFLAMLCFYILMSVMRVNRWLGVAGAVAYAFATYNPVIIGAGHDTKMMAIAYMPAVLAGLALVYRKNWISGAALLGVALALMISSNHFQILYYFLIAIVFYGIAKLIITVRNKGDIKGFLVASLIALAVSLLAVGTSMSSILTTQEYAKTTMRGGESELTINKVEDKKAGGLDKDYAFSWSNGIGETLCLMIPSLYGGSSGMPVEKAPETEALVGSQVSSLPLYWGPQPFLSGPVYFGAIICFLFVLGLLIVRSPHKWWILAVCVLTIMMSWGKNFPALNYWLFDNLPMYNKFRTPSMILIIPQMLFPLLGIWAVAEIISGKTSREEIWKKLKLAVGITAGICLLVAIAGGMFFDYSNPQNDAQLPPQILGALKEDRAGLAARSALTSAVFILLAAAVIWAFIREKISRSMLTGGLIVLIMIDLFTTDSIYFNEENYEDPSDYESVFQPRPVDVEIMKDPDPYYRVLDLSRNTYNDAIQSYFHKAVGGYSPAKMEIYQDLIDMQLGGSHSQGRYNAEVLNMLNTKYIIFNTGQNQTTYMPNPQANGNAWFVDNIQWAKTADEEMQLLNAPSLGDTATAAGAFDSKNEVVLRSRYENDFKNYLFGKDSAAYIRLVSYGLNDLVFESQNSQPGLAVFSDIYYPHGWEAYVDGQPAAIYRANYVLRAIKVPAGKHKIEFHFRPQSFETGNTIALFSSLALIGILLAGIYRALKGRDEESVNESDIL